MNADHESTTSVEVVLRGRKATIEDVQQALDTLRAEGIPDTFNVDVTQSEDRVWEANVASADQKREHVLRIVAKRAARSGASA